MRIGYNKMIIIFIICPLMVLLIWLPIIRFLCKKVSIKRDLIITFLIFLWYLLIFIFYTDISLGYNIVNNKESNINSMIITNGELK